MTWRAGAGLAVLALALRLAHIFTSAKLLIADDAVFFEQNARAFRAAWTSLGRPELGGLLREAVDGASLQGVVYPFVLSVIYLAAGGVAHHAAAVAQALMGAATVWLTYGTTRRAFGSAAALAAGATGALYGPLVLSAGVLLAEATLLLVQALACYFLVRGLERGAWRARLAAGVCVGTLMLRPAFQYAGLLTLLGLAGAAFVKGRGGRRTLRLTAPYVAGLALVALPWLAINGLVFGQLAWSRTGDAWQQVYWGIYPPNRGWWPPDSPVPPKYGVESLPGARAAGMQIDVRDLDYFEAAVQQVRATPLQALATEVNKLHQAYLHPFNTYAEAPPVVAGLAVPLHRALVWLALGGGLVALWRPAASFVMAGLGAAVALPFLASHIDVRYVVPIALAALPFAGCGLAAMLERLAAPRGARDAYLPVIAVGGALAAWALGESALLALMPALEPLTAHRAHTVVMCAALCAACVVVGRWLLRPAPASAIGTRIGPLLVGLAVAVVYGIQGLYDGDWHEWSAVLRPGEAAVQRIELPRGWSLPAGARAEVRLYATGAREQNYVPVVLANGREVARLGPAFTEGGPLRFEERLMVTASQQGKVRADVPQWYGVPLDPTALQVGSIELRLTLDGPPGAWIRVWGDYRPQPGTRVLEAPSVHSRIQGQDDSFHKFVATGHTRLWRRFTLASPNVQARLESAGGVSESDLSQSPGRQVGEYRLRILVFGATGELVAVL